MANRKKTERNQAILKLWDNGKGMTQRAIAEHMHMGESAVSMIICRARQRVEQINKGWGLETPAEGGKEIESK